MLSEFLARYPLVQFELLPTDRVIDMVEEGIDVALRIGRLADTSFMARKIGEDKRLICAAPSYLARHGTPQRPEDLARHNCIVSRDHAYLNRWSFKIDDRIVEIDVRGRVAVSEGEAQMQLALQGVGIVRLTRLTLAQAIREGSLVPLLGDVLGRGGRGHPCRLSAPPPSRAQGAGLRQFPDREVHAAAVGNMKRGDMMGV